MWIAVSVLLLGAALCASPAQEPASDRIDFDRLYASPTITDIGEFVLFPGGPVRMHIHVQWRSVQYVCSAAPRAGLNELKIGTKVELRARGNYVYLRRPMEKHWLKLRLVQKAELHNL